MKKYIVSIGRALTSGKNLWEVLLTLAVALAVLFSFISISATEGFLALAIIFLIVLLIQKRRHLTFPAFFWPLLVYAGLSLISSILSVNPEMSLMDSRELLLFLIVPLVYTAVSKKKDLDLVVWAILVSALASSLYSLYYYFFLAYPGERVKGFMGHYMTQAGLLLLFGSLALGMVFFGRGKVRILWGAALGLAAAALVMTLTRSGWIGLAVGLCLILLLWKPKTLILVPLLAGLVFVVSPQTVKKRALSIFSLRGASNRERVQYFNAGIKIIKDFSLFGTGPDTVDMVFQNPKYGLGEMAKRNVHLHNNFLQIAAERGIVALAAWSVFIVWAFAQLLKLVTNKANPKSLPDPLAAGGLAALAAFVVAGLFEYNFGDSEVVTLLLLILTLPLIPRARFRDALGSDPETSATRPQPVPDLSAKPTQK
jgi:O-antigen ligase